MPAPKVNPDIQRAIYNASSSQEITDIMTFRMNEILHSSLFGKAMKRCSQLEKHRDSVKHIKRIMDMMLHQKDTAALAIDDVIEFSIFFSCMAQLDKPDICERYFAAMIHEHALTPNLFIFAALVKSCRAQGLHELADKYWSRMRRRFRLSPNSVVCTEMLAVYAKAHQMKKAKRLFAKHADLADMQMLSAYLSVFARVGDIDGMKRVLAKIQQKGFALDASMCADVMSGYLNAKQPAESLRVFADMKKQRIRPNRTVLGLKCLCLCYLLQHRRSTLSSEALAAHYREIERVVFGEFARHGFECGHAEYELWLRASVCFHRHSKLSNPLRAVAILEGLLAAQRLVITDSNAKGAIDLHRFSPVTAQLVLRYVLGVKLRAYADVSEEREAAADETALRIIVGQGKHRSGRHRKQGNLKRLVAEELRSLEPPVESEESATNKGVLVVKRKELEPYLANQEMNDAEQWLRRLRDGD